MEEETTSDSEFLTSLLRKTMFRFKILRAFLACFFAKEKLMKTVLFLGQCFLVVTKNRTFSFLEAKRIYRKKGL
jgi:hypothetical protein